VAWPDERIRAEAVNPSISLNLSLICAKAIIGRGTGEAAMVEKLAERAAYGRTIRHRAICLLEAHGPEAWGEAISASREPGLAEAERSFWEAVAARIARQLGQRAAAPAA
jgi:hypothetical protein